jgi:hypothetical protein
MGATLQELWSCCVGRFEGPEMHLHKPHSRRPSHWSRKNLGDETAGAYSRSTSDLLALMSGKARPTPGRTALPHQQSHGIPLSSRLQRA